MDTKWPGPAERETDAVFGVGCAVTAALAVVAAPVGCLVGWFLGSKLGSINHWDDIEWSARGLLVGPVVVAAAGYLVTVAATLRAKRAGDNEDSPALMK